MLQVLRIKKTPKQCSLGITSKLHQAASPDEMPVPFSGLMTWTVLVAALNYAVVAFLDISLRSIQPLFFSTSINEGGLGMEPHHIGRIISLGGLANGIALVFFFPRLDKWLGTKKLLLLSIIAILPSFALLPIINVLARFGASPVLIYLILCLQIFLSISNNFAICELIHSITCWISLNRGYSMC